jgi:acylphosphatase
MLQTISIHIKGKVQGVYYRQSCKEMAVELGITGKVMNLPDETVEVTATGTEEQLNKLIVWCGQGPRAAVVTGVEVKERRLQLFERFVIQRF